MLEELLTYLNNWFTVEIHEGTYTVADGTLSLPFLADNQYFRVCGSIFNDGLHQYPDLSLTDEAFKGTIWALAVPNAVIELAKTIADWRAKHDAEGMSPYQSESFGGYSYSKASATNGSSGIVTWQMAFAPYLNRWRKI